MKILSVITRLNVGGPARQAIDVNRELIKKGHSCRLVSGPVSKEEGGYLEYEACKTFNSGWPIENPYSLQLNIRRELNWKRDRYAFIALRRLIKDYRPDILHTRMSKAGFLARIAALTISKKRRPKLVHTFHGHTFHSYFGSCKSFLFRKIEQWLSKRTDAVIAISKSQKEELSSYGIKNLRLIPLGFDLDRFLKLKPFTCDSSICDSRLPLVVAIIGRLTAVKNHKLFFEFVDEVRKYVDSDVIAYVIGGGEMGDELKQLSKKYKYDTVFSGWKDPAIMHRLFNAIDIVICTSKNEGTPVGLIEAMAAGRLVMSTEVGGCKDLIDDDFKWSSRENIRGLFIDENSFEMDAKFLKMVLEDGSYKNIINNAREYVKKYYKLENLLYNIENLYKELL